MNSRELDLLFPRTIDQASPFLQQGEWALHELLHPLARAWQKVTIRIATFSISEEALRSIHTITEEQWTDEVMLLVDTSVGRNKAHLLLFAQELAARIRLTANHAKVLLVENKQCNQKFGIVGSANLNKNHRYESGFYFYEGTTYDYFRTLFDGAFQSADPLLL